MATMARTRILLWSVLAGGLYSPLCAVHGDFRTVHMGYVVPLERTPQKDAVENLQAMMTLTQAWYSEQMDRWGFGPRTFRMEMNPDGLPAVHVVRTPTTAGAMRTDIWGQTIAAAQQQGLPIWNQGEVWFLVPEAHVQNQNGSISGGTALGASFGSGDDSGTAMLGSDALFRAHTRSLLDATPYAGRVVPEVGPYPFVQDVSFPWFELNTISSISSSIQGAAAHELGHAFGLPHNFIHDENFRGNVMGNGFRGWRSFVAPSIFGPESASLSYASALALSTSRYFRPDGDYTDQQAPAISLNLAGDVAPVNGLLGIPFSVQDNDGLAAAILLRNGDVVAEQALAGLQHTGTLWTPYYEPNRADNYELRVYDRQGNKAQRNTSLIVAGGHNRAPQPSLRIEKTVVRAGDPITVSAQPSVDPDDPTNELQVEWDLNGDGIFDTEPSANLQLTTTFSAIGSGRISARLTDSQGAAAVASPLAFRVISSFVGDLNGDQAVDAADGGILFGSWSRYGPADLNGDGVTDAADAGLMFGAWTGDTEDVHYVPEPTAGILVAATCGLFGQRIRSK